MLAVGCQANAGDEAHGGVLPPLRHSGMRREGADPESIITIVSMDSGLALRAPRNDGLREVRSPRPHPQYDFGRPSTFSAMKLRMSCGLIGAMRGIRDSRK